VSVADITRLVRELTDGDGTSIEDMGRSVPHSPIGIDANGDGRVDRQDLIATTVRVFRSS
jgi:hypothetical protein